MSKQRRKQKRKNTGKQQDQSQRKVKRNIKDRLFRFLFVKDKEALLELYNALNGTAYTDSSKLEIVTIKSAVYNRDDGLPYLSIYG